jgi:hypothetical protein
MSLVVNANVAGTRVLTVAMSTKSEREASSTMAAQDGATETQSEGLRERPTAPEKTALDRLVEQPSPLDRFAD